MTGQSLAVVLDLDGTLVDSVYQHVYAWQRALHDGGRSVPGWRVHAAIGMGSDRLLPWLTGRHLAEADELSAAHTRYFLEAADDLRPTNGALQLLDDLERRQVPFLVATSAGADERKALLDALGRGDVPHTDSEDVAASKPAPDLLLQACAELDAEPGSAIVVGDSPWDAEAARRIGAAAVGVRCGGFADETLAGAGAVTVVDDPAALIGAL